MPARPPQTFTARQRAALRDIIAGLTGRSADLLPYEEVKCKLKGRVSSKR
jgi:ribosome modulation factor